MQCVGRSVYDYRFMYVHIHMVESTYECAQVLFFHDIFYLILIHVYFLTIDASALYFSSDKNHPSINVIYSHAYSYTFTIERESCKRYCARFGCFLVPRFGAVVVNFVTSDSVLLFRAYRLSSESIHNFHFHEFSFFIHLKERITMKLSLIHI